MAKGTKSTTIKIFIEDRDMLKGLGCDTHAGAVHKLLCGQGENYQRDIEQLGQEIKIEYLPLADYKWRVTFPVSFADSSGTRWSEKFINLLDDVWSYKGVKYINITGWCEATWSGIYLPGADEISKLKNQTETAIRQILDEYQLATKYQTFYEGLK
jgi:hypothetical protein